MIKRILLILTLIIGIQQAKAQRIFATDATWRPGYKVFVVNQAYKADLLVYKVDHNWEAKGDKGLWKMVEHSWQADHTVIFVEDRWKADFLIYFCDRPWQAGWRDAHGRSKVKWK